MSDPLRKDFSTKAKEAFTPDSTKSTQEKVKEGVTDTTDRLARGLQPDGTKSTTQSAFDHAERSSDREVHGGTGETILDKAKDACLCPELSGNAEALSRLESKGSDDDDDEIRTSTAPEHSSAASDSSRPSSSLEPGQFYSFVLDQFSIYKDNTLIHPNELAPLHHLCVKPANNKYYFDGVLTDGRSRYLVQHIPFDILSIGNYCDVDQHGVGDQIWIQSSRLQGTDTWYQLGEPAPEYRRYHVQFVWMANFAKHFTDFLQRRPVVHLHHFRQCFHQEMEGLHGTDADFRAWLAQYGDTDFRRVITAHPDFLHKEAVNINSRHDRQPVWFESHPKSLLAIRPQLVVEQMTVVTSFVYDCFKDLPWGRFLAVIESTVEPTTKVDKGHAPGRRHGPLDAFAPAKMSRGRVNGEGSVGGTSEHRSRTKQAPPADNVLIGDVLEVERDVETVWKGSAAFWYAYVQGVRTTASGRQLLDVLWLYASSDTTCSSMRYPIPNELFFSDHCNCGDARMDSTSVIRKVTVDFHGDPERSAADFVVRQKYRTDDAAFVTLRPSDFQCSHVSEKTQPRAEKRMDLYRVGDTVLYQDGASATALLEPAEVLEVHPEGHARSLLLRRLLRMQKFPSGRADIKPNELIYTDDLIIVRIKRVERKCYVRFFTEQERARKQIPPPYNRDGTGDAYYITCRLVGEITTGTLEPLARPFPSSLIQGFDPHAPPPRTVLRGMDLYCGGGNFGRGLEEGGAVENKWAVDYDVNAIHTYHANLKENAAPVLYYGSVNDLLAQALVGLYSKYVPSPGEVDFISAGSPCQGFSTANQQRSNEKSLKNSSLVASVAAYVDFYRPKYALMENVVSMASKGKKNQAQNVFSQLLCCLVGMGYQVQQFTLDAWSFGSPQSRSRLFISIAAAGLELPPHPALSHAHPPATKHRGLGVAANGLSFGMRRFERTPFDYVSIGDATKDLPFVGDARTQTCIPHPDHRPSRFESYLTRAQITQIPVVPRGQTFMMAFQRGRLGKPQIDSFKWENRHKISKISKSWQRIDPNGLMPTVTTTAQPSCSFTGTILHWDQHRVMTVMEVRRAQGFPDDDVLVGHPAVQWKIVGNSVARTVALALGLSLREAWLANPADDHHLPTEPLSTKVPRRSKKSAGLNRAHVAQSEPRQPGEARSSLNKRVREDTEVDDSDEARACKRIKSNGERKGRRSGDLQPTFGADNQPGPRQPFTKATGSIDVVSVASDTASWTIPSSEASAHRPPTRSVPQLKPLGPPTTKLPVEMKAKHARPSVSSSKSASSSQPEHHRPFKIEMPISRTAAATANIQRSTFSPLSHRPRPRGGHPPARGQGM
ncbi:MAG: DNA methyltransferase Dim-2 [Phylliscum demangeonii]|nr:MAG: DNA methyltransferase Dim-2 [Phylliscum demangeonii]